MRWWELARNQAGVVSHRQLVAGGLSSTTISRMSRSGELQRLSRGVYLAGGPLTWHARLWAAVLATDGVLALSTAGRLWGVCSESDEQDDAVHVIVPADRHRAAPHGVQVHRTPLRPDEVRTRSGLTVTSRPRTVVDLLATLPYPHASRLADRAVQRGWVDRSACRDALEALPGRPGNAQLRALGSQFEDGAAARSERVLHRLLRGAGVTGWIPNHEVWSDGELLGVLDVAIPWARIAVEVDGMAYHVDVDRFRRDRARQNALVALGWTVVRFTWADLTERPGYVVATIVRMLDRAVG